MTRFGSMFLATVTLVATFGTALGDPAPRRPGHHGGGVDFERLRVVTDACESAFEGDANEQQCVASAMRARGRRDVVAMVRACESAFDGDANEQRCLDTMVGARRQEASVVAACERVFDGDANEQACLEVVAGSRQRAEPLIAYCEEHRDGDAAELACLSQYR